MLTPSGDHPARRGLILVVGDDESERAAIAKCLETSGLAVRVSGRHAVPDCVQQLKPDIIVYDLDEGSDITLPFRANGEFRSIPVICLVETDNRDRALSLGAMDCLTRPFSQLELLARTRAYLELHLSRETLELRNMQLMTVLENIGQGVCLFNSDQRLVLANRHYAEVYGLSPEVIKPGATLDEITQLRYAAGAFPDIPQRDYMAWCDTLNLSPSPQDWVMELNSGKVIRVHHERTVDGGWVSTHEDITERRDAERRIAHLALHDPLTDLPNRTALKQKLDALLEQHSREKTQFALLYLDLDRFKEVNDLFGHSVGDLVLRAAAKSLCEAVGDAFVARLGGDEFMILAETDAASAAVLADRIIALMNEDADIDDTRIRIGASLGVAIYPADGDGAGALMSNADAALYRAKSEGRGTARFFEPRMDQWLRERRALQRDLLEAIAQRELSVFYQPQANIGGNVTGFEALLRWNHPIRGNIPPSVFIPIAEESRLMLEIGEWVLREACREASSWPRKLQIAVNLSPVQFKHGNLFGLVQSILLETGLEPERLELEITESVLISELERVIATLGQLKSLGVRIAMDDFGTGYSSLSYLQSFPFDKIKIDQSFVRNIGQSSSGAIIRAVIGLGRGLNLPIIAEGVETTDQLAFLTHESCDQVQGYLVGRPRPITDYAEIVGHSSPQGDETVNANNGGRSAAALINSS